MSVNPPSSTSPKSTGSTIPISEMSSRKGMGILAFVCKHPYISGMAMSALGIGGALVIATIRACYTVPSKDETTVESCKAKFGDKVVPAPVLLLRGCKAVDPNTAFLVENILSSLPKNLGSKFAHAILCGAHVVLDNVAFEKIMLKHAEKPVSHFNPHLPMPRSTPLSYALSILGLPPSSKELAAIRKCARSSSHYTQKDQYGIDVILSENPKKTGHLLIGKTPDGKTFFQLEKHGTRMSDIILHMFDWVQHKWGGNVQVGSLGYVQSSEKNGTELVVKSVPSPLTGASTVVIQQKEQ